MSDTTEWSSRLRGEVGSTLLFKFPDRNKISSHTWDVTFCAASPLHCLAMTRLSNSQNLQKVENDIVIFNGNVLGHAWHTWYKKGTYKKRMSCSLLICHMQIFKSIDFRTMGLWNSLTFFWYAVYTWIIYDILCHSDLMVVHVHHVSSKLLYFGSWFKL